MDQKTWLWRKKSSEKTILANLEEARSVSSEKEVDLENSLKTLNERLASVVDECSAKDELVQSYKKTAEDAVADKQKAEEEISRLKEELVEVQQQRVAANERLGHLNSALKDCMDQLSLVRQEQDQRVHDAVMKTSKEFEKSHKKLDEKLSETGRRLASLTAENSYLSKALLVKEELIEDLNNIRTQTEAEFEALMTRLDSVEKENAFLRYEFMSLEKELDLRNEEVDYGRRSAEASHKQHLENVKKIKKLEAECQRLRALTRKQRLPGPAAFTNTQRDIEVQGRNQSSARRKALSVGSVVENSSIIYSPDDTNKQLSFLIDQVQDLLRENKIFKECLAKKEEEIFCLRKDKDFALHEKFAPTMSNSAADVLSVTSGRGVGDSNEINSSHSRAIALVSEQEDDKSKDLKTGAECKMIASEMSLMDDFAEMEKLAIVAVDSPLGASFSASDVRSKDPMNSTTKELVPVGRDDFSYVENMKDPSFKKRDDWLHAIRNTILEQHNSSKRSLDELLGDIRTSLQSTVHTEASNLPPVSGYLTWKSPASSPISSLIQESSTEILQSDLNRSISKMIELVGQFDSSPPEDRKKHDDLQGRDLYNLPCEKSSYRIHVFRWKKSELTAVLQEFIHSCKNVLDGKISFEKFTGDLASILGWIINKSISYQDHSAVRDEFRKQLGGDGPGTALQLESVQNLMLEMEKMYSVFQVEIEGLKNELSFVRLSDEALMHKLLQSQQRIESVQNETETLKESKRTIEDQMENLKLINEDLDTQLAVARAKLNEVLQKLSSAEVELENKRHCCEELEGTCLELQLQLASITSNRYSENNENQGGLLQTGLEITKASAKLAECEETILKLGKQLKTLGSAKELSVVDKVLSITDARHKKFRQRSSLRDQMICEDNAEENDTESPKTKEIISTNALSIVPASSCNPFSFPDGQVATPTAYPGMKNETRNGKAGALVIVPSKKKGGGIGFLRKLLLRRKKASSKSTSIYFGK